MAPAPYRALAVAIGALLLAGAVAVAQPGPGPGPRRRPTPKGPPAACQQMLDEMKASDARFDEQVKRMNESQGSDRVDAVVAALNELAARHRTMRERMASMPCMAGGPGCPMMGR